MIAAEPEQVAVLARPLDQVQAARQHRAIEVQPPQAGPTGEQSAHGSEEEALVAGPHVLVALPHFNRPVTPQLQQLAEGLPDLLRILDDARDGSQLDQFPPLAALRAALL